MHALVCLACMLQLPTLHARARLIVCLCMALLRRHIHCSNVIHGGEPGDHWAGSCRSQPQLLPLASQQCSETGDAATLALYCKGVELLILATCLQT